MQYERRLWIYTTASLLAVLILVLVLGLTGQLFYSPHMATNHVLLGEDVKINLTQDASSVSTLSFNGSCLPGDRVMQNVELYLPFEGEDCYVRANFYISSSNGDRNVVKLNKLPDWTEGTDGYYYYNGPLTIGQTVSLTDVIILPEDMSLSSQKVYTIVIATETIRSSLTITSIWQDIPIEAI